MRGVLARSPRRGLSTTARPPNAFTLPDHTERARDEAPGVTKQIELEVPPTHFVAEDLVPREGQVLSHTRTHVTPGRILQHLLARGAVRPENLRELERLRTSTLPP